MTFVDIWKDDTTVFNQEEEYVVKTGDIIVVRTTDMVGLLALKIAGNIHFGNFKYQNGDIVPNYVFLRPKTIAQLKTYIKAASGPIREIVHWKAV